MASSTAHLTVDKKDEWILGPLDTPFFTSEWSPSAAEPAAYIIFMHGFSEHIKRYDAFFSILASEPYNLHITAFDQRGHGRTGHESLTEADPQVKQWREEGKKVTLVVDGKRKTGGWAKVMPDIEFFVRREAERAKGKGKPLWLWGFSMGGAQALAFCTRPSSPPSRDTLSLLSGVISGGPLIRQTRPAPWVQLFAGSLAAKVLPNNLIPTPLKIEHLSHNEEANNRAANDPFCEQVGSLRGVADMLQGGISMDGEETWKRWPRELPLLVYHGEEDKICDPASAGRFVEGVQAERKHFELVKGMYHEVHNEHSPVPEDLAKVVAEFILKGATPQARL